MAGLVPACQFCLLTSQQQRQTHGLNVITGITPGRQIGHQTGQMALTLLTAEAPLMGLKGQGDVACFLGKVKGALFHRPRRQYPYLPAYLAKSQGAGKGHQVDLRAKERQPGLTLLQMLLTTTLMATQGGKLPLDLCQQLLYPAGAAQLYAQGHHIDLHTGGIGRR